MEKEKAGKAGLCRTIAETAKKLFARKNIIDPEPGQKQQNMLNQKFLCLFKEYFLNEKMHSKLAHDKLQKFERMLEQGANPNLVWDPVPLLFHAVFHRDAAMVRLLLKHHADPNAKDQDGMALLAWSGNEPAMCSILIEHGAK
jgi:ankyrin repeat protein